MAIHHQKQVLHAVEVGEIDVEMIETIQAKRSTKEDREVVKDADMEGRGITTTLKKWRIYWHDCYPSMGLVITAPMLWSLTLYIDCHRMLWNYAIKMARLSY